MPVTHKLKLIILDEPVEGTCTTPSPKENAAIPTDPFYSNHRPQFYFRAHEDETTNDNPVEPLILVLANTHASPQGQDAFEDLTLQRGVETVEDLLL